MIDHTWLDRPLGLAGVALVRTDDPMRPARRLVAWDEPLAIIPNVAIHLNREVNKGVPTKPNVDMLPLCRTVQDAWEKKGYLVGKLAERLGAAAEDILSFELCAYCHEPAQLVGFEQDLLSSARLDNLTSVHACLRGLLDADGDTINLAVLYDNEEIGSNTRRGADSSTLTVILEKLADALGLSRAQYLDACVNGMLLSCDAAHAVHPNHPELAAQAYEGAEASLFDENSSRVRIEAFRLLARLGASSPELSDKVWPLLDEAIQCFHGDLGYRDMLDSLLEFAEGNASDASKQALVERISFDVTGGRGYVKTCSAKIADAVEAGK